MAKVRNVWLPTIGLAALACAAALFTASQSQAVQRQGNAFSDVQVVTYATGPTGFFDTRTGILYMYDAKLDKPLVIRQIDELGEPLVKIKN